MKCKMCGEGIPFPREVEVDNGICIMCMEGLAENVDDSSAMPIDEFALFEEMKDEFKMEG